MARRVKKLFVESILNSDRWAEKYCNRSAVHVYHSALMALIEGVTGAVSLVIWIRWCWRMAVLGLLYSAVAQGGNADQLFQDYSDSIVQIKVVDVASESKSAIGSGFVVHDGSLIATNYHVISSLVSKPERYRIEVINRGQHFGDVQIIDVDVVNDLALLRWSTPAGALAAGEPFRLADQMPRQGEPIYSFGNPMDIGMTVVPGTYNGLKNNSFFQRVHLTASVNPGMSGGPALNERGEVVGVNVSTAGNQISFLVPVGRLQQLLLQYRQRGGTVGYLEERIRDQLLGVQESMFGQVLAQQWRPDQLGDARIIGEVAPFVVCWGDSDGGDKTGLKTVSKGCHSDNYIYMDTHFNTGFFEYEFTYLEAETLSPWRFYSAIESAYSGARPGNRASQEDVTDFQCNNEVFSTPGKRAEQTRFKAVFCSRQYRHFPQLYDVFYIAATINRERQALISHFTLSGVSQDAAMAFTERFIGGVGWR